MVRFWTKDFHSGPENRDSETEPIWLPDILLLNDAIMASYGFRITRIIPFAVCIWLKLGCPVEQKLFEALNNFLASYHFKT